MRITPPVDTEGLYELKQPWVAKQDHVYKCIANRTMVDLLDDGIDILNYVYTPVGLSDKHYNDDVVENAYIISLQDITDSSCPIIHIPDTYIISYPNMDISNYNRCVVSVDLGALPVNTDVTAMLVALKEAALDMIGVVATPKVHVAPSSGTITGKQHQELLKQRIANKKKNKSSDVIIAQLRNENTELRNQLDVAIKYINDNIKK